MVKDQENISTETEPGDRVSELRALHAEALADKPQAEAEIQAMTDEIENDDSLSRADKIKKKLKDLKPLQAALRKINRDLKKFDAELKENGIDLEQEAKDKEEADIKEVWRQRNEESKAKRELEEAEKVEAFEKLKVSVEQKATRMLELFKKDGGVNLSFDSTIVSYDHPDFRNLHAERDEIDDQILQLGKTIKDKENSWIKYGLSSLKEEMEGLQTRAFKVREKINKQIEKHNQISDEYSDLRLKIGDELNEYHKKNHNSQFFNDFPFISGKTWGGDSYAISDKKLFDHYGFDYTQKS